MSYCQVDKRASGPAISPKDEWDPNSYLDIDVMMKRIQLSDFYDHENMPFISYFDSYRELRKLPRNSSLKAISSEMKTFNKQRKEMIYARWEKVLSRF